MKADAVVEIDLWAHDKDEDRRVNMPTKTEVVPTDILLGDGNAEVSRAISMRLAGGDYNAIVLGTNASVTIKCNQDDETIVQALKACEKLATKAIKDYQPIMEKVLHHLVTEKS